MPQENQKNLIVKRAKTAVLSRDFDLAERLYKGLHRAEPKNIEYLYALGDICVQKGDDYNALNYFLEISSIDPSNFQSLNSLGGIYRRLGQYTDSVEVLQRALDIAPDETTVLYNFGFTYREMGRFDRAIDCFQRVIDSNPHDVLAHNHLGVIYAAEGDHGKAIESYKRGLHIDPNHPILQLNLAQSYEAKKQYDAASSAYETALRSKPGWKDATASYKNLLISQKKYKQASDLLKKTVSLHPNDVILKQELGNFFISQCDYKSAIEILKNAQLIDEENTETKYLLSEAYEKAGNVSESVSVIEDVAENKIGDTKIQHRFAHALLSANEIDRAGEKISALYEADNKDVQTLDLYGQYYICKNDEANAKKYYEQIENIDPTYDNYMQEAAERFLQMNNIDEADKLASEYLQKNQDETDAYITLAKVRKEKGDIESAVDLLRRGTGNYPENSFANEMIEKISENINEENIDEYEENTEQQIDESLNDAPHDEIKSYSADEDVAAESVENEEDDYFFGMPDIDENSLKEDDDKFDFDQFENEEVNITPKKEEFSDLLADEMPIDNIPNEAFAIPSLSVEEDGLYSDEDIHSPTMIKRSAPIVISEKPNIVEPTVPEIKMPEIKIPEIKMPDIKMPDTTEMVKDVERFANSMSDMANLSKIVAEEARRVAEDATKNLTDNVKKEIEDAKLLAINKTREATEEAKKAAEEAIKATEEAVRVASEETANAAAAAIKEMDTLLSENLMQLDSMGSELAGLMANATSTAETVPEEDNSNQEDNLDFDSTMEDALNLFPHIVEILKQKNELKKYTDLLSLFQNIKNIINSLPAESLHEFKTSKTRIHLDYLISRLEGKPGLLATATALREAMAKNGLVNEELTDDDIVPAVIDLDGEETDDDDELISNAHDKIENAIAQMGMLATSLEDQELAQALVEFADEVLGKLNFGE